MRGRRVIGLRPLERTNYGAGGRNSFCLGAMDCCCNAAAKKVKTNLPMRVESFLLARSARKRTERPKRARWEIKDVGWQSQVSCSSDWAGDTTGAERND